MPEEHVAQGLASDTLKQGVWDESGLLTEPAYTLVTQCVPIVCVDIVPINFHEEMPRLGIITRATGPERGKAALLGGRILKDEMISAAIGRHLMGSLGSGKFAYHKTNGESQPFCVQQFLHKGSAEPPNSYDPTKHAVTLTYLVDIDEPKQVQDEASEFRWIKLGQIPKESAYNHHLVMQKVADFLQQKSAS